MPEDALHEALENVQDRTTFLRFVEVLIFDRKLADSEEEQGPELHRWHEARGWQNSSIAQYLDSALHCLVDNEGRDDYLRTPSWRGFAEFLYGGKIYE